MMMPTTAFPVLIFRCDFASAGPKESGGLQERTVHDKRFVATLPSVLGRGLSGDDVGEELILDRRHPVFDGELLLF